MKLIAILPARSSSHRLPEKNFKPFFGRPIFWWPLLECMKSEIFGKIVISIDMQREKLPFMPQWLKQNVEIFERQNPQYEHTVNDVVNEVLQAYPSDNYYIIYPTAYAITAEHLLKGYGKYSFGMLNGDYKLDNGGFYYKDAKEGYEMPMVDINTMEDFIQAKLHALTLPCGKFK